MPVDTSTAPSADTIRVLVATDNHVGFAERDANRGNDSWQTFHEVMCLAKENDVDMVLLAGDLFHENKPSRKSMYNVMRSLRMNCYGEKPCELEMLSDATEHFQGAFDHVNYEDPDINVAIPVFSIHGNHDDPSGEGHFAALDLLQMSGLVNYYGRIPESDNIAVKPVLLQKGRTKLALYGMSNVRDERLFRTFRDGKVKFYQPGTQKDKWFNLMSVHQNRHAYTETSFLNTDCLPDFMDLIIWGHEHECRINPEHVANKDFQIMQPGSSIATSLVPGESGEKKVAIVEVTGTSYEYSAVTLKTIRPFVMKEIILQNEPGMQAIAKQDNNRPKITKYLKNIVEELIEEANQQWLKAQTDVEEDRGEAPKPLVRLRVEYTAPEGGNFDCETPQRFSALFSDRVANDKEVVQFHRKKIQTRKAKDGTMLPEESVLAQMSIDNIKVEKLVREFLQAQSLTILPQNSFGDSVAQYVDKDDKHAMETFVDASLSEQISHLLKVEDEDDGDLADAMDKFRAELEQKFANGSIKRTRTLKPKPHGWDSEMDGPWDDQPAAVYSSASEAEEEEMSIASPPPPASRGRGRGAARGRANVTSRGNTQTTARAGASKVAATKASTEKAAASKKGRSKSKIVDEHDESSNDVMMLDDDDENDFEEAIVAVPKKQPSRALTKTSQKRSASPVKKTMGRKAAAATQSKLDFSQPSQVQKQSDGRYKVVHELSDDEISDDEDAFEPVAKTTKSRARK